MTIAHTLSRIVATSGPGLQFIWTDDYSETHAPDWTGWMRGVTAGHGPDGEYERYDGTSPFDDAEQVVAAFLDIGGVVEPYVAPVGHTLPDLAPYQFRAMLKLSGKQDALYDFLEALPEPTRTVAQAKLEYSLAFKRDNDLVAAAKQALNLSDAELDALWLQASSI